MKITNTLNANNNKISNLTDGSLPQDAVTKSQLDAAVQGIQWKAPVRCATTTNITLSGVQTIDGISISAFDRVLVKNQSDPTQNGLYVVAVGAWTRATDYDASSELVGAGVFVSEGTSNGNSQWFMTSNEPLTIGSSALMWEQIGGGAAYTAGSGIDITGGVISIDVAVAARKVAATVGDGSATVLTVTHNLNTTDVAVSVYDTATRTGVICDWVANGLNTVQLTFSVAPTVGQYRALIVG